MGPFHAASRRTEKEKKIIHCHQHDCMREFERLTGTTEPVTNRETEETNPRHPLPARDAGLSTNSQQHSKDVHFRQSQETIGALPMQAYCHTLDIPPEA